MTDHPRGSVVFAGCARNCSAYLDDVLENVERLSKAYETSAVVIFENDSTDDTAAKLQTYRSLRADVHVLTRPGLISSVPERTKRLAIARNACLDFIRKSAYGAYEELIVLDLDGVNTSAIEPGQLMQAREYLASRRDVHGVFANAQPIYYDIWALRHPVWCPSDCWAEISGIESPDAIARSVYSRMIPISPDAAPIDVISAFGGLGLYRMASALRGVYGDPTPDGFRQCEHVHFHQTILDQLGGTFAIFPALTNQTPWEHVLQEFAGTLRAIPLNEGESSSDVIGPAEHQLGQYRALFPLYDRRLPALSRLVSAAAPGSTLIDIGANIGDTAALCRLAGCTLKIEAIEASLSYFKLLQLNILRRPDLFGEITTSWAFVGKTEDSTALFLNRGTASVMSSDMRAEKIESGQAPAISLNLFDKNTSLLKIDTDGYDDIILEDNSEFLESAKPIIWAEAQSETARSDERWGELLLRLSAEWPWLMAFDNFGLCLLAGESTNLWRSCSDLIKATRRYRRSASIGLNSDPRIYYLDVVLFPARFTAVFESFRSQLPELAL